MACRLPRADCTEEDGFKRIECFIYDLTSLFIYSTFPHIHTGENLSTIWNTVRTLLANSEHDGAEHDEPHCLV